MALVLAFLSVENENRQLEDFPRADFGRLLGRLFNQKTSSVGKDKVNKLEFCKLKITTIVVFVVVIQRIFSSWELAPTHSTIVIRGLSIHLYSFKNEIGFSSQ